MNFKTLDVIGSSSSSVTGSDSIFKLKFNPRLIKYVLDWQFNHQKPRTAKTKQRNEVKGSTKKIYAQKGTGQARHASIKAPLFVGGGQAHGPKGAVYKIKKINKKTKKLALSQILAKKNSDKNLFILNDVKAEIKKTKDFYKFVIKNKLEDSLIVSDKDSFKNLTRSTKNIKNIKLVNEEGVNVLDIINYKNLLITSSSLKNIEKRLLNEKN
jgi:large subunit ribosomal protein L4